MIEIGFLSRPLVEELHKYQIERFGRSHGLRDEGMLESALARPIDKAACGCDDVAEQLPIYTG